MLKVLRTYWAAILVVILVAGIVWSIAASQTFQNCVSSEQDSAHNKPPKDGVAVLTTPQIYRDCIGTFVVSQHPAITAFSTFIIAIFTIVLAWVTGRQAKLTKEALIADKSAFVFPTDYERFWEFDPVTNHFNWRFRLKWKNSGDTAATDLVVHAECEIRNTALPRGHRFNYAIAEEWPGFLGPNFESVGGIAPLQPQAAVTAQDIVDAQAGRKFIYLWGWTRYNDVFPNTPRHLTKFCWLLYFQGDPLTFVPFTTGPAETLGTLYFGYVQHHEGNSAEDE